MLLRTWVQEGAKVDLNQRISGFDEISVLKTEKHPTLRGNITKCLAPPGLKLLVVFRGISKSILIYVLGGPGWAKLIPANISAFRGSN